MGDGVVAKYKRHIMSVQLYEVSLMGSASIHNTTSLSPQPKKKATLLLTCNVPRATKLCVVDVNPTHLYAGRGGTLINQKSKLPLEKLTSNTKMQHCFSVAKYATWRTRRPLLRNTPSTKRTLERRGLYSQRCADSHSGQEKHRLVTV